MEVKLRVPGLEKLLDYAVSGIGGVAGPMLALWRARREAAARQIAAEGEVEVRRILAEGQASTMQIIANAQADARQILVSPDSTIRGELDIAQAITQRIQFQEEKRQRNIRAVVERAARELGDTEVPDHEPDHDWTARFFDDVQDVSSEEMQSLWAKVLAGEVERPGSTSIRTLSILRNLDQGAAILFRRLCSACCVAFGLDGKQFRDIRVPSLGGSAAQNVLQEYGLSFDSLNVLNEHGLIISDYNSSFGYEAPIELHSSEPRRGMFTLVPFGFQGRYWVLSPTTERPVGQEFRVSGVALTRTGRELFRIVDPEPMGDYAQALMKFFQGKNLQMVEVDSPLPQRV